METGMDLGLKGKLAVVTGGSVGIGLAVARGFAAEGCNILITARGLSDFRPRPLGLRGISGSRRGAWRPMSRPRRGARR